MVTKGVIVSVLFSTTYEWPDEKLGSERHLTMIITVSHGEMSLGYRFDSQRDNIYKIFGTPYFTTVD